MFKHPGNATGQPFPPMYGQRSGQSEFQNIAEFFDRGGGIKSLPCDRVVPHHLSPQLPCLCHSSFIYFKAFAYPLVTSNLVPLHDYFNATLLKTRLATQGGDIQHDGGFIDDMDHIPVGGQVRLSMADIL